MKNYETLFIVDSLTEEEKLDSLISKYSEFLSKNGCSDIKPEKLGRKKFSYPIKKKYSGSYISIEFTGAPQAISKLERNYQLDETILRYLTISYDKNTLKEKRAYFDKKLMDAANRERESAEEKPVSSEEAEITETKK